jgi:hypothetical protein
MFVVERWVTLECWMWIFVAYCCPISPRPTHRGGRLRRRACALAELTWSLGDQKIRPFKSVARRTHKAGSYRTVPSIRLLVLMDLYIHPLYVLVSKILSSILNSSIPIHPLYLLYLLYPLWDTLVTLSKYIHVWSSSKGFIETDLMVQSKSNLDFWFVSYSIFLFV